MVESCLRISTVLAMEADEHIFCFCSFCLVDGSCVADFLGVSELDGPEKIRTCVLVGDDGESPSATYRGEIEVAELFCECSVARIVGLAQGHGVECWTKAHKCLQEDDGHGTAVQVWAWSVAVKWFLEGVVAFMLDAFENGFVGDVEALLAGKNERNKELFKENLAFVVCLLNLIPRVWCIGWLVSLSYDGIVTAEDEE